ncbi:MAG: heme-binding protein [Oscillospiraceae bacterium]|nr:heme-binding protein [Oscillospiraceae bacterium]
MEHFRTEPGWLSIVREQEARLLFPSFSSQDALSLGLSIAHLCADRYCGCAAISILSDETVVFSYKMEGTGPENEFWMTRKLAASRRTGMSSLRVLLEEEAGAPLLLPDDPQRAGCFVACGGCFPLRMADGALRGYLLVSGLNHYEDHQVIADALSAHLGIDAPAVTVF